MFGSGDTKIITIFKSIVQSVYIIMLLEINKKTSFSKNDETGSDTPIQ